MMSAKFKGRHGAPTMKLTEVLANTAAIFMLADLRLTKCELTPILQIAPSAAHILLTEKLGLSRVCV